MSALLRIQDGEQENEIVCHAVTTIGRDRANDIVLGNRLASRHHAMIRRLGVQDYYLVDVGSSNGSYLNKERITAPVRLKDGDQIAIGSASLRFKDEKDDTEAGGDQEMERTTRIPVSEIKQITVLVADIRDYSKLFENLATRTLTKIMSRWFREVSDCVQRNGGVVDRFAGDCVCALWDTEGDLDGAVVRTLRAAFEINTITGTIGQSYPELVRPLRVGAGISSGNAAVTAGLDYTTLGDAANLAFLLEDASKSLERDVVLSWDACGGFPQEVKTENEATLPLKGKKNPVHICALDFSQTRTLFADKLHPDVV